MRQCRLTKRRVDGLPPQARDYFEWCGDTHGFGVRVHPKGSKIFIVQVRVNGRTRRIKIGPFGAFTVEQARTEAEEHIRTASKGTDPRIAMQQRKRTLTVAELCAEYLAAAEAGLVVTRFHQPKRQSTVAIDRGRISRHINPILGTLPVSSVTREDVQRLVDDISKGKTAGTFKGKLRGKAVVRGGAGTAARVVELLGGIFNWAEARGLGPNGNPAHKIRTVRGQCRDRILTPTEWKQLGQVLKAYEMALPAAVAAIRVTALTGLRAGEASGLQFSEIDFEGQCLRLQSTKTGKSVRPIGKLALIVLKKVTKTSSQFVFPSASGGSSADLKKAIAHLFDCAGLVDARSHDLRRSFASLAAELGYSDATIGELLGHARRGVTSKHYIRRPDSALIAAADAVSNLVAALLAGVAQEAQPSSSTADSAKSA